MKEYAKSFYQSDAWKKARQTAIKRANGLCERCRAAGRFVPGVIVHHKKYITPGNIHDARVTLALDNLELVCEDCHNKEHKAKHAARYRFDGNGNLLPPPGEKERVRPPRLSENYSYGFVSAFIFCTKNAGNDPFLYKKIPDLEN